MSDRVKRLIRLLNEGSDIARSDSLSAAFRNLDADAKEDLTLRYEAFCG